jgi:hypothetical protein
MASQLAMHYGEECEGGAFAVHFNAFLRRQLIETGEHWIK